MLGRLVTGDDDGYIVFWRLGACLDPQTGADSLSYRSHNTVWPALISALLHCTALQYVVGHVSGLQLVGRALLVSSSGTQGQVCRLPGSALYAAQVTLHDYWAAAAEDQDHTDSCLYRCRPHCVVLTCSG